MATNPRNFYTFRTNGNKTMAIKPDGCCLMLTILGGASWGGLGVNILLFGASKEAKIILMHGGEST